MHPVPVYYVWGIHAILAIWALIDISHNPRFGGIVRLMATLAIIFIPIIGPLMYATIRNAEPKTR